MSETFRGVASGDEAPEPTKSKKPATKKRVALAASVIIAGAALANEWKGEQRPLTDSGEGKKAVPGLDKNKIRVKTELELRYPSVDLEGRAEKASVVARLRRDVAKVFTETQNLDPIDYALKINDHGDLELHMWPVEKYAHLYKNLEKEIVTIPYNRNYQDVFGEVMDNLNEYFTVSYGQYADQTAFYKTFDSNQPGAHEASKNIHNHPGHNQLIPPKRTGSQKTIPKNNKNRRK